MLPLSGTASCNHTPYYLPKELCHPLCLNADTASEEEGQMLKNNNVRDVWDSVRNTTGHKAQTSKEGEVCREQISYCQEFKFGFWKVGVGLKLRLRRVLVGISLWECWGESGFVLQLGFSRLRVGDRIRVQPVGVGCQSSGELGIDLESITCFQFQLSTFFPTPTTTHPIPKTNPNSISPQP